MRLVSHIKDRRHTSLLSLGGVRKGALRGLFLLLFLLLFPLTLCAQQNEHAVLFGLGKANQYDSYLSPMEYRGPQFSVVSDRRHPLKRTDGRVVWQSFIEANLNSTDTKADNGTMLGGDIHYESGWHYNWKDILFPRLRLWAGGQAGATLGGLYSTRNGNNPANGHLQLRVSISAGGSYDFCIRRLPIRLQYQADLPVLGGAFSPNYGQSYYELFQDGGYDHNIVCTHPGNALSLRQLFTIDFRFKHNALRIGYLSNLRQGKFNNLRQHQYGRSFMIGWVRTLQ